MSKGEYIDPTLTPTVTITDSASNTLNFNSTTYRQLDCPIGGHGAGRTLVYVPETAIKNVQTKQAVLIGTVTVTITPVANTVAVYRVGPKNPTFEYVDPSTAGGPFLTINSAKSLSFKYTSPFTIVNPRPGFTQTVLRIRAYQKPAVTDTNVLSATVNLVSPNWKSPLVIIKFIQKGALDPSAK